MKNVLYTSWYRIVLTLVVLAVSVSVVGVSAVRAADNQATGDLGGDPANLDDSNVVTINATTLALVKAAFLPDSTQLANNTTVPRGTLVQFLIYVDNSADVDAQNLNVEDVLAAGFAYQAGTLKVDASQATGATVNAIYLAVVGTTPITDEVGPADVAGITGTTISAGSSAGNAQLDVPADTVWAMLFTVEVQ